MSVKRVTFLLALIAISFSTIAQQLIWTINDEKTDQQGFQSVVVSAEKALLMNTLADAPIEGTESRNGVWLQLPMEDGALQQFFIEESPIMESGLSEKFPEIKTYIARGDNGITWGRLSVTHKGFHGMVFSEGKTIYIDQYSQNEWRVYDRKKYLAHKAGDRAFSCGTHNLEEGNLLMAQSGQRSGEQLRTYQLALSCTGEYTQYHGGTVADALSAMVVTMNRVNGIYERDLAIRMVLINENDLLVYTNPNTDPYDNGDVGAMIQQNGPATNSMVGTNTYDIGHVFYRGNGGGLAGLAVVCKTSKARGVTGTNSPQGDPFDVDYVAHEMGHQFGAEHTQNNNCNRNPSTAFEPGSGSTIMGYAGICSPNLQNNSDDYFHAGSYDEIIGYTHFSTGNTCASKTNTGNSAPVVTVPNGGFYIPKETPFLLDGSALDADGDNLTYCWEQMDLGPSGHPNSPSGNAPIFRSWEPVEETYRFFPRFISILLGNSVMGETYPTYARDLNFRLTVRDNNPAAGGVGYDEISFKVAGNAGPFEVLSPASGAQLEAGNYFTVEWDVAETDTAPVNCALVDIFIFYNFDFNVRDTLALGVPNKGSVDVIMPYVLATTGRVMVKASNNVFFNVNEGIVSTIVPSAPGNYGITLSGTPDYISDVQLTWTDSFSNENYFMIEHSSDSGQKYVLIDSVDKDLTTYTHQDVNFNADNFYRVYAKNAGGASAYSNIVTFDALWVQENVLTSLLIYPNPASEKITIELMAVDGHSEANLWDMDGKVVATNSFSGNKYELDISNLAAGTYTLEIVSKGKRVHTSQVTVAR